MNIVVCIKQIIDPEIKPDQFHLDPVTFRQIRGNLPLVISAYDQNALEAALQLREKAGGHITALCVGDPGAGVAIKSALGMGVDAGALVCDFDGVATGVFGVAHILVRAIEKIGAPDLILTGCVSGDTGHKVIAPLIAEELDLPCTTFVSRIEARDGKVILRRVVEDGYELINGELPIVVSILSDETNVPRYPKMRDIMIASKKPLSVWKAIDLEPGSSATAIHRARIQMLQVGIPHQESRCEMLVGETPEERAEKLALRLQELKFI